MDARVNLAQLERNKLTLSKIVKAVTLHPRLIPYALSHQKEEVFLQHERLEALRIAPSEPFHGDSILQQLIVSSIQFFNVKTFFETGTFRGDSIVWLSNQLEDLDIMSVEVDQFFHARAAKRILHRKKKNKIRLLNNDSAVALKECFKTKILGDPTLFWLDAHWYNQWPLIDEITLITRSCKSSVILIDDFKVPCNLELGFDTYNGTENSIELIRSVLDNSNASGIDLLYPNYRPPSYRERGKSNHRGYVAIYLGLRKLIEKFLTMNQSLSRNFIHEIT
jgi:predicted O-methyltransferase YrrM